MEFKWLVTTLEAVMAVIPNVPAHYFLYYLAGGWLGLLAVLALYIEILGKSEDSEIKFGLNIFWLYMAGLTLAFLLTRASPLEALGWVLISIAVFILAYVELMAIRDRFLTHPRWSGKWWVGMLLGVPKLFGGYLYDVQFSLTVGRLMFLQKPRLIGDAGPGAGPWKRIFKGGDWTYTANLKRNIREGVELRGEGAQQRVIFLTWQGAEAYYLCKWIVERADPGHCGLGAKPSQVGRI